MTLTVLAGGAGTRMGRDKARLPVGGPSLTELIIERLRPLFRTVIVAGAFGTYLDVASAIEIGLFPEIPLERFQQVGNAAGEGARQLLLSNKHKERAEQIEDQVEYSEFTVHDRFTEEYLQRMFR